MINELLKFTARKGLEYMIGQNFDRSELQAQIIAKPAKESMSVKINGNVFSLRKSNIANELSKVNADNLINLPLTFNIKAPENLKYNYAEIKENKGDIKIVLTPVDEYAENLLRSFNKEMNPELVFSSVNLPKFENPRM